MLAKAFDSSLPPQSFRVGEIIHLFSFFLQTQRLPLTLYWVNSWDLGDNDKQTEQEHRRKNIKVER